MRSKVKKHRIWELDFFRGFAILMVVWDHLMVDFTLFGNSWMSVDWLNRLSIFGWDYVGSDLRIFWRPVFLFIFFTVSGLCTAFSKNNLWRGIKLALVSIGLSIFTYLFSLFSGEDYFILFGVLHCMAAIIIIYALLRLAWEGMFKLVEFFRKKEISPIVKKLAFCFVCLALSAVFFWIHSEYNASVYATGKAKFIDYDKAVMGIFFYTRQLQTADYFPLFPYISYFFLGAGLSGFLYPQKKSLFPMLDGKWNKAFTIPGRYSLIIYLSTQLVLFLVLSVITFFETGRFPFL
ncbi:MAG: heparan-alpha-glucosaminide N-acetyltransferase domain-containing protein [Bacillota bacterium]|nr:heparan-alpha-glucosaminide N-acetyltransferase domain-containing protein [Bacillota bacterium]HHU43697.1 DUF1624 domain-containing protein [Clostridiales bacterium]